MLWKEGSIGDQRRRNTQFKDFFPWDILCFFSFYKIALYVSKLLHKLSPSAVSSFLCKLHHHFCPILRIFVALLSQNMSSLPLLDTALTIFFPVVYNGSCSLGPWFLDCALFFFAYKEQQQELLPHAHLKSSEWTESQCTCL